MRDIVRISVLLSAMAALATVGSFLIDYWGMVDKVENAEQSERRFKRDAAASSAEDEPVQQPKPSQTVCNLLAFEAIIKRLRSGKGRRETRGAERLEWLGADRQFDYYYDFVADEAFCRKHTQPTGPMVRSTSPERVESLRQQILFWATLIMAVSAIGLLIVRHLRLRK